MSAEEIARVIRDIRTGNVTQVHNDEGMAALNADTAALATSGEVIDVTPVWARWMDGEGSRIYEDHRVCPPWDNAFLGFVNGYGNVTVVSLRAVDITQSVEMRDVVMGSLAEQWDSLADTHTIDWDRVRWVMHGVVYMGGRGHDQPVQTLGPLHLWRIAVYPDGEIADINWIQVTEVVDMAKWDTAMMVMLDTFNLANCVNVHICEPDRPRPQAKRLHRAGVKVNEIHIRPVSKSYRGKGTPLSDALMTPLTSVRGHMAVYGTDGRGKLFGKYTGRYWIPPHIRGSEAVGTAVHEYTVEP